MRKCKVKDIDFLDMNGIPKTQTYAISPNPEPLISILSPLRIVHVCCENHSLHDAHTLATGQLWNR